MSALEQAEQLMSAANDVSPAALPLLLRSLPLYALIFLVAVFSGVSKMVWVHWDSAP